MRPAFSHPALLGGAVVLWVRSGIIVMEAHAPAAAKDAVVALHQRGERGPRRLIESLHGVRRFGHESSLTRTTARASSSRTIGAAGRLPVIPASPACQRPCSPVAVIGRGARPLSWPVCPRADQPR